MSAIAKLKRIALSSSSEAFGVGVSALSGFLIVNILAKSDYAQYTFLTACFTLIIGLSDMGLAHCYLPIVGDRNKDVSWVLKVARCVYGKRWRFIMVAAFFIIPYWIYTSVHRQWMTPAYLIASVLTVPAALLTIREQVLRTIVVIFQKIVILSKTGVTGNGARLLAVALILGLSPVYCQLPLLISAPILSTTIILSLYHRIPELATFSSVEPSSSELQSLDKQVTKIVKPLILPSLFIQFQGVITIVLTSIFANTGSIAEVGALSRLSLLLTVVDRTSAILVFPMIAGMPEGRRLRSLLARVHAVYIAGMGALLLSSILFGHFWILLLGAKYEGQADLVWMSFLAAILVNGSGFAFTTLSARGITQRQGITIPLVLIVQSAYLLWFGISDTRAALGLAIASAAVYCLFQYSVLARFFLKIRLQPAIVDVDG